MSADAKYLIEKIDLVTPLIGVYDAPENTNFGDVVTPPGSGHACIFAYYKKWQKGIMLKLSRESYGCGGCGTWMFGEITRSRQEYIEFLADDEGLKADHAGMGEWFDSMPRYHPEHKYLFIGKLHEDKYKYLKAITFFVNPDQLSALMIGANYYYRAGDAVPVIAPFGSGCMQMLTSLADLDKPQALIGATDMAMRKYLPKDILAFTMTVPMYKQLCRIDENSFLNKPFIESLKKARKGKL